MRLCIEPAYCFGRDMQDLTPEEERELYDEPESDAEAYLRHCCEMED